MRQGRAEGSTSSCASPLFNEFFSSHIIIQIKYTKHFLQTNLLVSHTQPSQTCPPHTPPNPAPASPATTTTPVVQARAPSPSRRTRLPSKTLTPRLPIRTPLSVCSTSKSLISETKEEYADLIKTEADEKAAMDQSNVIDEKTRGATKPKGTYTEPGDEEVSSG